MIVVVPFFMPLFSIWCIDDRLKPRCRWWWWYLALRVLLLLLRTWLLSLWYREKKKRIKRMISLSLFFFFFLGDIIKRLRRWLSTCSLHYSNLKRNKTKIKRPGDYILDFRSTSVQLSSLFNWNRFALLILKSWHFLCRSNSFKNYNK